MTTSKAAGTIRRHCWRSSKVILGLVLGQILDLAGYDSRRTQSNVN
jgi:hypothetical protein